MILADDLTGAMDTGVQIYGRGQRVTVCIDPVYAGELSADADLLVADSESRNATRADAERIVNEMLRIAARHGLSLVYKKIDSTLRGNVGAEIDAVFDSRTAEAILVAPALPHNGRTTLYGVHYVNGRSF